MEQGSPGASLAQVWEQLCPAGLGQIWCSFNKDQSYPVGCQAGCHILESWQIRSMDMKQNPLADSGGKRSKPTGGDPQISGLSLDACAGLDGLGKEAGPPTEEVGQLC